MRTLLTKYTYGAYDESLSVNAALFGFGISTVTCLLSGKSLAKDLDDFMAASTDLATLGSSVGCFVAGTTVKTEDGDKNIEEIKAGDKVLSYEATTGRFAYKEVAEVIAHDGVTELAHVTVGRKAAADKATEREIASTETVISETIDSTTNHPYFVVGYGYVDAGNLIEGDTVLLANGEEGKVERVEIEFLTEPVTVYNFEVKDWHCYFVGEAGVLVHNGGSCTNSVDAGSADGKTGKVEKSSPQYSEKELKRLRQKAVKDAWKQEQEMVKKYGIGSRDWTPAEKQELINTGRVKGYEGQHMKSAKMYPKYAGDPNNIQFLKGRSMDINEHLDAHMGNYQNVTNWYYDPQTGTFIDFGDYYSH